MSSLGRSVFALVSRRATIPLPPPSAYLASSFASSSRLRLDSTPFFRAENPNPNPLPLDDVSAQALENALNTGPIPSTSTGTSTGASTSTPPPLSSSSTPTRTPPPPATKSKYRVPPPNPAQSGIAMMANDESIFTLTVTCTRNNTTLTFSDRTGPLFPTISGGTDKTFKNSQRASYEAAHQAALKMFEKMEDYSKSTGSAPTPSSQFQQKGRVFSPQFAQSLSMGMGGVNGIGARRVKVVFSGLRGGQGREAVANAISGQEGDGIKQFIGRVEDRTGIKIGGTRGKKRRRL